MRCCAVRTVARATTIRGAIVLPASRASCARELAARAPGSVMTNCLDGPPSIIPPSASSSLLPSQCSRYWLFPFAERHERPPLLNQNPKTTYVETGLSTVRTWRTKDVWTMCSAYNMSSSFVYLRPQWWVTVLLVQQAVHWSVILNTRWIHCCLIMSQRKWLEPSLCGYVIGWYFIKGRLETRIDVHTFWEQTVQK